MTHHHLTPQPGDVVEMPDPYDATKTVRGVIDGGDNYGPDRLMVVLKASAFRGHASLRSADDDIYVSCSGGPCPNIAKDAVEFVGTTEQRFWWWKRKGWAQAHNAVEYVETVNLWRKT